MCDRFPFGQDADVVHQQHETVSPDQATIPSRVATKFGCADNGLGAVGRQCFYLALPLHSCKIPLMLLGTPNLYLDHSAVSNETWWPQIDAVLASVQVRLALSLWNLVEIGCGTDRNQQDRRLAFLEQDDPLWIVERVVVQRRRSNASSGKGVLVSLRETFAWLRHISRSSISITPGRKRGSDCRGTGLTASISTASPSARSSLRTR